MDLTAVTGAISSKTSAQGIFPISRRTGFCRPSVQWRQLCRGGAGNDSCSTADLPTSAGPDDCPGDHRPGCLHTAGVSPRLVGARETGAEQIRRRSEENVGHLVFWIARVRLARCFGVRGESRACRYLYDLWRCHPKRNDPLLDLLRLPSL